jgi:outer membrane lipoprotein SlyB
MRRIKGEITTQQIVLLIILLVSFIIILFLLFRLDLFGQSDSELCHNSIIGRGNPISKEVVPLQCSRAYICITKDGDCVGMTKPDVEKVKTKEEIYSVLAEQMANCWWMFGEGRVDYVADSTLIKNNYCSLCSQILFDDSLKKIEGIEGETISKDEFYNYLSKTKKPGEDFTYSYYLFGTNDITKLKSQLSSQAGTEVSFGKIDIGKQYFVVTGITSNVNTVGWIVRAAAGGAVAAVAVASGGFIAVAIGTVVGGVAGGVGGPKISDLFAPEIGAITIEGKEGVKNQFMVPTIQEASSEEFELLNCDEILTST